MIRKLLLSCGIVSSIWYIGMNIFVPQLYPGYDMASQTVSELSAVGAPTRSLWLYWGMLYTLLFAVFGWGIMKTSGNNWLLYMTSILVLVYAAMDIYWPPMHMRGHTAGLTDSLHIVWTIITILLMLLIMVIAAAASGRKFRLYTYGTIAIFLIFGIFTAADAPGIPKNLPTPYIGIWERINIAAFMFWVTVFSVVLLKRESVRTIPVYQSNKSV